MSDRHCGTCRHWTFLEAGWGRCAVLHYVGRDVPDDAISGDTVGCPGWSSGDDYGSGWRDAIAAADKLVGSKTCSDCDGLSQLVETIQPPE